MVVYNVCGICILIDLFFLLKKPELSSQNSYSAPTIIIEISDLKLEQKLPSVPFSDPGTTTCKHKAMTERSNLKSQDLGN